MCNKLCTYRKYIVGNGLGEYDLTENPHIILAAREDQGLNYNFIGLTPAGDALINLSTTNFHLFYLGAYYSWTDWVSGNINGGISSLQPSPSNFTDNGTYEAFNPVTPGLTVTLNQSMVSNFPIYNVIRTPSTNSYVNWSMPPLEFADNISADQYVPKFVYTDTDLDIANAPDTMLLVEFLDVTGSRCKY